MSMTTMRVEQAKTALWVDHLRCLWELTKPRITAMVLVSVGLSVFVASGGRPDLLLLLHTLLGTTLVAASSSAWNQWIERQSDSMMLRTAGRPLPTGRMGCSEVLSFGLSTFVAGTVYLLVTVGWQPTLWAVATWIIYVCVYTPMKAHSAWNTTVGAVSGALPVVIGWSATGTPADWRLASLVLVLFFWQFPHFISIAWIYRQEYEKAGLKMVTTTDPSGRRAGWYAVLGATLLLPCSLLPLLTDLSWVYACLTVALGGYQLFYAHQFQRELSKQTARRLLTASIIYLPLALGVIGAQSFFQKI